MTRSIKTFEAVWNGIRLAISWDPDWLDVGVGFEDVVVHLQVRSQADETIPITETGYRLHFTACAAVEAAGGPIEYVLDWLDHAAVGRG